MVGGRTGNADGDRISSPNSRYLQWRAVLTGDASGSPALTSVTAAYLPRNLRPEVLSITVHPPGTVFQRPFSTGELEIAGFDDNTSDGRQPSQAPPPPAGSQPTGRRHSGAGSTRGGCRRSSGKPRTATTIACSTTCSIGAKARPGGKC